jgi:hypothetical protein
MSYTTTLHYVPKASWRSLSGSAQNWPVFESFRDDRLASVRVATGKGAAVEETVRKLVLTLPHARARSRPALTAGQCNCVCVLRSVERNCVRALRSVQLLVSRASQEEQASAKIFLHLYSHHPKPRTLRYTPPTSDMPKSALSVLALVALASAQEPPSYGVRNPVSAERKAELC